MCAIRLTDACAVGIQSVFIIFIVRFSLGGLLQIGFVATRSVFEIREHPSNVYSWTALVTAQLLAETPLDIIGTFLFFVTYYWTIGFPNDRAAYSFLIIVVLLPMYYMSLSLAIVAMTPNLDLAAVLFSVLFALIMIL